MTNRLHVLSWIALLLVVAVAAREAFASVVTVDGKGKVVKEKRFVDDLVGNAANVYTVPEDRRFVITDVLLRNAGLFSADVHVRVAGGDSLLPRVLVKPGESRHLTFTIGPELKPGDTLRAVDVANANGVSYYVSGYLTK